MIHLTCPHCAATSRRRAIPSDGLVRCDDCGRRYRPRASFGCALTAGLAVGGMGLLLVFGCCGAFVVGRALSEARPPATAPAPGPRQAAAGDDEDWDHLEAPPPRADTAPAGRDEGGPPRGHEPGQEVHVKGYTRKDGTYVPPHTRAAPGNGAGRRR